MKIYLDMDGTFVDLYGVENWLCYLQSYDATPYKIAKPLVNLSVLAKTIHELQSRGIEVGIISWTAKNSNSMYDKEVEKAKKIWLQKHLPTVIFDEIHIVSYGTPKNSFSSVNDILFDDELNNREMWSGIAYDEMDLIKKMRGLL